MDEADGADIEVSPEVVKRITSSGEDHRLSTTCYGPVLHPLRFKRPKETDIVIDIGENLHLYVSIVQARYINRIDGNIIYVDGRR
jgi:hypothetical protein